MSVGSLALTVIGSWKPGSPNALAAGSWISPEASKYPCADAGALSGVAEAAEVGDTWPQSDSGQCERSESGRIHPVPTLVLEPWHCRFSELLMMMQAREPRKREAGQPAVVESLRMLD